MPYNRGQSTTKNTGDSAHQKHFQVMKNTFFTIFFASAIGVAVLSALAFSDRDAKKDLISVDLTEAQAKTAKAEMFAPRSAPIRVSVTDGAITNSENDTLSFPYKLDSNGTLGLSIQKTNVSGTTNIGCIMQMSMSAATTPTDWLYSDSASTSTATTFHIKKTNVEGSKLRLIVDGRGTQSSTYKVIWLYKPTN